MNLLERDGEGEFPTPSLLTGALERAWGYTAQQRMPV